MTKVSFPYGKEYIDYDFSNENFQGTLVSRLHSYKPEKSARELVLDAMASPIGSKRLCELAKGKNKIVIIASDHTRPVPSKIIIPPMLEEIRSVNPNADITFLIATGCHRDTKREELVDKFGEDIVNNEKIVVHDCADKANLVKIGILPSGGELYINRLAYEADLLVSEGFIEPHFFAGFSGGRKSLLPGVAARETVLANHCSEFIAHPLARTGILEGNPIHEDMLWAAKKAKLEYIVNVVINEKKEAIYAVAGDVEQAHLAGCKFLSSQCKAKPIMSDIAISTNGGYPLDQNIYQAVKGMTAAEATVNEGGVIIMLAKSSDGHGGEGFYRQLADEPDIDKTMKIFLDRGRNETVPDQWQTQIFLRILKRATVIYISDAPDNVVRDLHMIPAKSIDEALIISKKILNKESPSVVAIPDGVAVMVVDN
ncbi:MAG: nickel-dependent lactate racemase [Clostridia bacterium]|nr:nickel-dependent lactate racemase [Clostridia bacterium]